jgi:hypothetical protein
MNIEINIYSIRKRFEECVREETVHLATLKSKKIYKLIAFLKTLQRLEQELQVSPALDQANRGQKLGLVWRNRKKFSQMINAYLYITFLIILWIWTTDSDLEAYTKQERIFKSWMLNFGGLEASPGASTFIIMV